MHPLKPWLELLQPYRARLWLGAVLLLLTLVSAVSLLGLSGWFITATGMTALAWAAGVAVTLDIYTPGGGIRLFALTRTLGRYLERVYNHDTVLRLLAQLRQRLFQGMTKLDPITLTRWRASQWVNRLMTDVETLDNLYLRLLAPPLVAAVTSLLLVVFIALFHLQLALLVGLGLVLMLLITTYGMALAGQDLSARLARNQEAERSQLVEHLQGLGVLLASHALREQEEQRLQAQHRQLADESRLQQVVAWGQGLQTLILQLLVAASLLLLASAYQQGWLSGPVLVMLPLALMAMQESFQNLPSAFAHWGGTRAAAERLNQATQQTPEVCRGSAPVPNYQVLRLEGIQIRFGLKQVLTDFHLDLKSGEKLAVLATSGTGKSTLAALIVGQLQPQAGQMQLLTKEGWIDLADVNAESWLAQLGYLTQNTELLAASLADNLRLACPEACDDDLWEVLELVELADEVRGFQQGLDTWVGETGQQLSGGQARRLALARVLLKDSPLVILDEPFRGLDAATRDRLLPRLEAWLQGRTALFLAHDADHLPRSDRQLLLTNLKK